MIKIAGSNVSDERSATLERWHDGANSIATGLRDSCDELDTMLDEVKGLVDALQGDAELEMAAIMIQNSLDDLERLIVRADAIAEHLSFYDRTGDALAIHLRRCLVRVRLGPKRAR